MKTFLNVSWENLLVVNYRLKPGTEFLLEKHLPPGTVLDDFRGEHYVSLVAFEFKNTRILGVPIPIYRNFAELNLRFYVKRQVGDQWRRGVVFIKEIVPCRVPALVANKIFKENFHIHPLCCGIQGGNVRYDWTNEGEPQRLVVNRADTFELPEAGSLTQHITDHFWAYKKFDDKTSGEFQVEHRDWLVAECPEHEVKINLATTYGSDWADAMGKPVSVFLADGSAVGVTRPTKFQPAMTHATPEIKTSEIKMPETKNIYHAPIPDGLF